MPTCSEAPSQRNGLIRTAWTVGLPLLLLALGCGSPNVVPPTEAARSALETSLSAWKDGKLPQSLAEGKPVIHAVDTDWINGRSLTGYEITGEAPSDADKRFSVKLELTKPEKAVETIRPAPKDERSVCESASANDDDSAGPR